MTPADHTDWRHELLDTIRGLITEADPGIVEEAKWVKPSNPDGVPTWSHDGLVCTGEIYAAKVKVTFASGAALEDPTGLFNSSLEGRTRRAIDIAEGEELDARAFTDLVRRAVDHNVARAAARRR